MNHEDLKLQIGANITLWRKRLGMTQAELAQRLNYSDKAVSKWERGESVPDVLTLAEIAQQFGITVNELIYGGEEEAAEPVSKTEEEPVPEKKPERLPPVDPAPEVTLHNRKVIQGLVSILVWIVALAIYVTVDSFGLPYGWLAFFVAIPANAITLLALRCAWHMYSWNMTLISAIMWGSLICLHCAIFIFSSVNTWRMFLMGVLGQAAIILWFKLQKKPKEAEHE